MSWQSNKYFGYNRDDDKEEFQYWLELFNQEHYYDPIANLWDEDCDWWYYYGAPGYVGSMDEYHQMKVMTLLRKLNIKSAIELAKEKGW